VSAFRLGILSDLHRSTDPRERGEWHNEYDFAGHASRLWRALAWFAQAAVDALALCGDLTHAGGTEAMSAILSECRAGLDVPVIAVSGNHDVVENEDWLARGSELLADDLVVLGDPAGLMISGIRVAGLQVAPASGYMRSHLRDLPAVQDWGNEPAVLVSHLPLLSRAEAVAACGIAYVGDALERMEAAELVLARHAPTIVVSGHIHVRDAHADGPVLQLLQSAMIEPPWEAAVLEVRCDAGGEVLAGRRTLRTSDRQAEFEPTLVGPVGAWRFADSRWTTVAPPRHAPEQTAVGGAQIGSGR
jgi:predicted phosphodiesterase